MITFDVSYKAFLGDRLLLRAKASRGAQESYGMPFLPQFYVPAGYPFPDPFTVVFHSFSPVRIISLIPTRLPSSWSSQ